MSITVSNLFLDYGRKEVLADVSLSVERGGFYAVMGANGCGKTTLLRCIGGLLKPTAGEVRLMGRPVASYSARELARTVSMVSQRATTDIEFRAREIVLMGRNPYQRQSSST